MNAVRKYVRWTERQTNLIIGGLLVYLDEEYPGYELPNEQGNVGLEFVREALPIVQMRVLEKDFHKSAFSRAFQIQICGQLSRMVWQRQLETKKTQAVLRDASFTDLVEALSVRMEDQLLARLVTQLEGRLLPEVLKRVEETVRIELSKERVGSHNPEVESASDKKTRVGVVVVGLLPQQVQHVLKLVEEEGKRDFLDLHFMEADTSLHMLKSISNGRHVILSKFVNHAHQEAVKRRSLTCKMLVGGAGSIAKEIIALVGDSQ
jgi:hypothetical protein